MNALARSPTIALFPEASFGAALNCVGIAQALRARGARPVFICHAGFSGVFADYGFQEYELPTEAPLSDSERQSYWQAFVRRHLPHFRLSPIDQLETYVAPTWEAIVDTAINAEAPLRQLLPRLKPDAVVLDNVVMFPAIAAAGCPWVRVISCAETELPDAAVPPYLSGLAADDKAGRLAFEQRYLTAVAPAHDRYNDFRAQRRHGAAAIRAFPGTIAGPQSVAHARYRAAASAPSRSTRPATSISKAAFARKGRSMCRFSRAMAARWSISVSAASAPWTST